MVDDPIPAAETGTEHHKVPALLIGDSADHNILPRRAALLMHSANGSDTLWQVPGAQHGGASSVAPAEFSDDGLRLILIASGVRANQSAFFRGRALAQFVASV